MKRDLVEKTCIFLLKDGYTIKSLTQSCFDIVARKEEKILLLRILEDANSLTNDSATEMKKVSNYFQASPIIIAEKAGTPLQDNIVYLRCSISSLSLATFKQCVQQRFPFVVRDQTGLAAILKGPMLKEIREKEGFSLSYLSKRIGVSKRMIQQYENQESKVTISRALKVYNFFGDRVFDKVNVFSVGQNPYQEPVTEIGKKFEQLGFNATETRKVPFDLIARMKKEIILTEIGDKTHPQLEPISHLLDASKLAIYSRKKPKKIPSLTRKEFLEFDKALELIRFLKESQQ